MKIIKSKYFLSVTKEAMGHSTHPLLDPEMHPDRSSQGLEGPFRQPSGHIVYYDPKEQQYYDPRTDMYISSEEFEAMQRR